MKTDPTAEWDSDVMRAMVEPDHCGICRVSDDPETASKADLIEAVRHLDRKLAEYQKAWRRLVRELEEARSQLRRSGMEYCVRYGRDLAEDIEEREAQER